MVIINDYQPLHVKMGRTLLVSGIGLLVILLSTLVLVPMNGYWMNKKLGAGLILAYTVTLVSPRSFDRRADCPLSFAVRPEHQRRRRDLPVALTLSIWDALSRGLYHS